jgi:small subunit ribosomal protein S21
MTSVYLRHNESFDSLLRRFKRAVDNSGTLAELKTRERFEKPSQKIKRKKAAAVKRELKRQEKFGVIFKGNQNFRFNHDKTEKIPLKNSSHNGRRSNQQSRPQGDSRNGPRNYGGGYQGSRPTSAPNNYRGNNYGGSKPPQRG